MFIKELLLALEIHSQSNDNLSKSKNNVLVNTWAEVTGNRSRLTQRELVLDSDSTSVLRGKQPHTHDPALR